MKYTYLQNCVRARASGLGALQARVRRRARQLLAGAGAAVRAHAQAPLRAEGGHDAQQRLLLRQVSRWRLLSQTLFLN